MKIPTNVLSLTMTITLAIFAAPLAIADDAHQHVDPAAAAPVPNSASARFATDAALREGMSRIHDALDALRHYEMGHMPQALAEERVESISTAIDSLFANCKLDAQADAALHAILIPLVDAVQAFKTNSADTSSVAAMRQAVANYPQRFDDPEWPLADEAHSGHY